MVGRLVENEEIGLRERHERERNASPLAAAECTDLAKHFIAAEAERTETILHRRHGSRAAADLEWHPPAISAAGVGEIWRNHAGVIDPPISLRRLPVGGRR